RRLDKAKKTSKNEIEYFKNATEYLSQKEFNKATSQIKEYQSRIDYSSLPYHDNAKIKNPEVSIIIVAYNTNKELVKCIKSVLQNNVRDYEIIVVDNGGNDKVLFELLELPIKYIRTPINFTPSEGRNIGVHFSKGKIVAFLDDDALVPANYIESIIQAFLTYDIVGFRGKVLPKTKSKNNQLAEHYNLGEVPIPASINTEGNSAFLREKYLNVGGMNPLLFGGEGMELSYRMAKINSMNSTIYWPKTIIYHDFAKTNDKLSKKSARHELMHSYTVHLHTDIFSYYNSLTKYSFSDELKKTGEEYLIKKREKPYNSYEQLNTHGKKNIVMFWYQNDWGLYGRRNEMLAKTLVKNNEINKVVHIEPPINIESLHTNEVKSFDANIEVNKKRSKVFIDNEVITYTPTYSGELTKEKVDEIFRGITQLLTNEGIEDYILWLYPPHFMSRYAILNFSKKARMIVSDIVDDHRLYAADQASL
ncbi:MAG: glycosyltransferase family 2 protein, partial [Ignavibacteriae bacterium]|nr:glycosyltransferase family 2 protein [Ignavibacteriota bacterium]